MSRFLDSISTIINVFYERAKEDGDGSILSRREMKEFILEEFADVIANPRDSQTIDKILHFLEWDGDGKIDFNEFLFLVFRVAKACYWYMQKGPCLLQRTKLITSGKSLQEPGINNKGHQRQLQEEEPQICESNRHRCCEPQPQRDTRVHKLETLEEPESHHQQRNTQNRDDEKRTSKSEDPTYQVYEERSQEPCNQRNVRQPPKLDGQEDVQNHSESRKPKPLGEERGSHQTRQAERNRDVKTHCAPHESESQLNERGSLQARQPEPQVDERQNQEGPRPGQAADVKSCNQPSKPQPLRNRWSSYEPHERAPMTASNTYERTRRNVEVAAEADVKIRRVTREPETRSDRDRRERDCEVVEVERIRQGREREEPTRERRIIRSGEVEVEVSESTQRLTWDREDQGPINTYERTQRTIEVAAEDDVRTRRITREPETRSDRDRRERDCEVVEVERIRQGREREEPTRERRIIRSGEVEVEVSESTQRLTRDREDQGPIRTYERTQRTIEVAAEADVRTRRVTREPETRSDRDRRERDCEVVEVERIRQGREREEPTHERRIVRSGEVEVEVSESTQRLTRDREDQGPINTYERTQRTIEVAAEADARTRRINREPETRSDRDRRERDCEVVEVERIRQGREREEPTRERRIIRSGEVEVEVSESTQRLTRDREDQGPINTYERTQRTIEVAAEADVKVRRVTKEPETRSDRDRRERDCEVVEVERIRQGREREEPTRERRIIRSGEVEVEVSESTQRLTRDREDQGPIRTYERTQRTIEVAAEADVRTRRVTREPETRSDRDRRERDCEVVEVERIRQGREREEPTRERRIIRSGEVEVEVSESTQRLTRDREDQGPINTYERTQRTIEVAAEADVKVRRVTKEPETRSDRDQRERDCEVVEVERIRQGREREEPTRERRIIRSGEVEVEVSESTQRLTRDREDQGPINTYERTQRTIEVAAEADVRTRRVTKEPETRSDRDRRERDCEVVEVERIRQGREREEPTRERRIIRSGEVEVEVSESTQRLTRDREDQGPINTYERTQRTIEVAAEADVRTRRVTREPETCSDRDRRERDCEVVEVERIRQGREREEPTRERRIIRSGEVEVEVSESTQHLTQDREDQGPINTYERTQRTIEVAAEADVKVRRVTKEPETRSDRDRRERDCEVVEVERIRQGREREEPTRERRIIRSGEVEVEVSESTQRLTRDREDQGPINTYERTQRTIEVAAEADVRTRRVTKEPETRSDRDRRERDCEVVEVERIRQGREREEPTRERRIIRSGEVEVEVSESTQRLTRDREDQGPIRTYERTQRTIEVAAEADVRTRRVTREPETRSDRDRRERDCEVVEVERIRQGREREEPTRERRIIRSGEVEVEVSESTQRLTRDREDQGPINTYERTQRTIEVAAEADVKVRRVTKEPETRSDRDRRERDCEVVEVERIRQGREREEPTRERRIIRSGEVEVEVSESTQRLTRDREDQGPIRTYERTRRTIEVAAEADVRTRRVTREPETRVDASRRIHSDASEPAGHCDPRNQTLLQEQETVLTGPLREREGANDGRSFYQTVELDTKNLRLPQEVESISDLRVRSAPDGPDVRPEVQILPQPCDPRTVAYLVHVIQKLDDPKAVTYRIVCPQPRASGQPLYVTACPQPPAAPCAGSSPQEPERAEDERKAGEAKEPEAAPCSGSQGEEAGLGRSAGQQPEASSTQGGNEDLKEPQDGEGPCEQERAETEAKEGGQPEPPCEGVEGESAQPREAEEEDGTNKQCPRTAEADAEPQQDGSKGCAEPDPGAPESGCCPTPGEEGSQARPHEGESPQWEEGQRERQHAEEEAEEPECSQEARDEGKALEPQESGGRKAPAHRLGQRGAERPRVQLRAREEGESGLHAESGQEGRPGAKQSQGPSGETQAPREDTPSTQGSC